MGSADFDAATGTAGSVKGGCCEVRLMLFAAVASVIPELLTGLKRADAVTAASAEMRREVLCVRSERSEIGAPGAAACAEARLTAVRLSSVLETCSFVFLGHFSY